MAGRPSIGQREARASVNDEPAADDEAADSWQRPARSRSGCGLSGPTRCRGASGGRKSLEASLLDLDIGAAASRRRCERPSFVLAGGLLAQLARPAHRPPPSSPAPNLGPRQARRRTRRRRRAPRAPSTSAPSGSGSRDRNKARRQRRAGRGFADTPTRHPDKSPAARPSARRCPAAPTPASEVTMSRKSVRSSSHACDASDHGTPGLLWTT